MFFFSTFSSLISLLSFLVFHWRFGYVPISELNAYMISCPENEASEKILVKMGLKDYQVIRALVLINLSYIDNHMTRFTTENYGTPDILGFALVVQQNYHMLRNLRTYDDC